MSEKLVHLCVTREIIRPADLWVVRWLTEDDLGTISERLYRMEDPEGMSLEEWRQLQDEGYSYCGILLDERLCSTAGLWKRAPDVWEVIAVGTDKEYRRRGMARSVVHFIAEYILQHANVASYTSRESNIASIRTAQSVGFRYCINVVDNEKWCARDLRPPVKDVNCPLINRSNRL